MRTSKHRQRTSKETLDNREAIPYSWGEEINIMEMSILPKVIYQTQCNSYQNPNAIIKRTRKKWKTNQRIHMGLQKTISGQRYPKEESIAEGIVFMTSNHTTELQ